MTRKLGLVLATLACAAVARGVPVEKWVQTTRSDFDSGKTKGTAIEALGQVTLGPRLEPVLEKAVPHIWALAVDGQGALYAAAGMGPKLLRIRGGKIDTLFTSPVKSDIELLSVAVGPDGTVYAAAAPSGTLYRIGADGKAKPLYKGSDPYLWSLAVAADGSVFAGTGPHGKLLKIAPNGKATTVLKANASHVLSVLLAPDGSVYAGTDKSGLLYHVSRKGVARVVYDAAESDIRALALGPDGSLCFATAATSTRATPSKPTTSSAGGTRRTIVIPTRRSTGTGQATITLPSRTTTTGPSTTRPSAPGARLSATNSIYRLAANGDVTRLVRVAGVGFYTLAWHHGQLHAGTGNDGKLYRVDGTHAVQLADLDESQIMALAVVGKRLVLATANPGRIYRVAADHGPQGTLVSEVYDSASLSRWGQLSWEAHTPKGTSVSIATRTGNVARPDSSWSPWSSDHVRSDGEPIRSPAARFLQYRATLKSSRGDATPVLDEVVVAYVQSNRPPRVVKVLVGKAPKPRRPTPRPQPGVPAPPKPAPKSRPLNTKKQPATSQRGPLGDRIRILWQATDPNKDTLLCTVYFRGEGEKAWKKLRERLAASYLDWDSHNVPDGAYRVRVVASDDGSNPPDQALKGERVTEAFTIDNTPPAVSDLLVRVADDGVATITARCTDKGSGIAAVEYSIDAGDWTTVPAADGIFDSHAESAEFKTKPLDKGEHTIVVRAKDDADNSGAAKAVFVVK